MNFMTKEFAAKKTFELHSILFFLIFLILPVWAVVDFGFSSLFTYNINQYITPGVDNVGILIILVLFAFYFLIKEIYLASKKVKVSISGEGVKIGKKTIEMWRIKSFEVKGSKIKVNYNSQKRSSIYPRSAFDTSVTYDFESNIDKAIKEFGGFLKIKE